MHFINDRALLRGGKTNLPLQVLMAAIQSGQKVEGVNLEGPSGLPLTAQGAAPSAVASAVAALPPSSKQGPAPDKDQESIHGNRKQRRAAAARNRHSNR